jgi:hypothetical protein
MESKFTERLVEDNIVNPLVVKKEMILKCKHCDESLMKIVVMERKNTLQLEWNIFAHCFNCGSRSKTEQIVGQYAYSGIIKGEKEITSVVDIEMGNDQVGFIIKKVN